MRILLANKFYYRRGGDCICVLNAEKLLKDHGHQVAIFAMNCAENLASPFQEYFPSEVQFKPGIGLLEAIRRPFGTKEVCDKFNSLLDKFNPDVVHLNNIHSQLSPVIAEIAHKRGIRVIWTLHDYKLLCPRYDCLRKGKIICEECYETTNRQAKKNSLYNKCMKDSWIASLIAYKEATKWNRERLEAATDLFVCPSQFMALQMQKGGFSPDKLYTLCNFLNIDSTEDIKTIRKNYYCYVGRLSHEKGIKTLVEAAKQLPYRLIIIGGGMEDTAFPHSQHIEFVGYKQWDEIKQIVGNARFTVVPSEWYENNPLSVIEAESLGTPVLGANIGGIPELIDSNFNGMTFNSGNILDLKTKIQEMWMAKFNYMEIAAKARERFNAEKYYSEIMKIYTDSL